MINLDMASMGPLTIFIVVVLAACCNASVAILAEKWGITAYYQRTRRKWMPKHCEFCVFFWMAVAELMPFYFTYFTFDIISFFILVPLSLSCAAISRFVHQ